MNSADVQTGDSYNIMVGMLFVCCKLTALYSLLWCIGTVVYIC